MALFLVAEEVFETSNPAYEAFIYPDSPRLNWTRLRESNSYSQVRSLVYYPLYESELFGTDGRTRTNHTQIFSLLLYLMSYIGIVWSCLQGSNLVHRLFRPLL